MDEKQSKNDEFFFHLDSTKMENVTRLPAIIAILEFDKQYPRGDIRKGTFVDSRQLYLMLYEICYLDIPSILAQSFYVCTTKEDIIY